MTIKLDSGSRSTAPTDARPVLKPIVEAPAAPADTELRTVGQGQSLWSIWSDSKASPNGNGNVSWDEFRMLNSHLVKAPGREDGNRLVAGDKVLVPVAPKKWGPAQAAEQPAASAQQAGQKAGAANTPVVAPPAAIDPAAAQAFGLEWKAKADTLKLEASQIPSMAFADRPAALDTLMQKARTLSNEMQVEARKQFGDAAAVLKDAPQLGALRNDLTSLATADGGISWKDVGLSLKEGMHQVGKQIADFNAEQIGTVRDAQDRLKTNDGTLKSEAMGLVVGAGAAILKGGLGMAQLVGKGIENAPEFVTEVAPGMAQALADNVREKGVMKGLFGDVPQGSLVPEGFREEGKMVADFAKGIAGSAVDAYQKRGLGSVLGETAVVVGAMAGGRAPVQAEGLAQYTALGGEEIAQSLTNATKLARSLNQDVQLVHSGLNGQVVVNSLGKARYIAEGGENLATATKNASNAAQMLGRDVQVVHTGAANVAAAAPATSPVTASGSAPGAPLEPAATGSVSYSSPATTQAMKARAQQEAAIAKAKLSPTSPADRTMAWLRENANRAGATSSVGQPGNNLFSGTMEQVGYTPLETEPGIVSFRNSATGSTVRLPTADTAWSAAEQEKFSTAIKNGTDYTHPSVPSSPHR